MKNFHDSYPGRSESGRSRAARDPEARSAVSNRDLGRRRWRPGRVARRQALPRTLPGALTRTGKSVRFGLMLLRRRVSRYRRGLSPLLAFAREMLNSPRSMGAVCPSSPGLARAMARELDEIGDGLVLELGAGTGSITRALLQSGVPSAQLVAIERSPALAAQLRRRFPSVRVIQGDAMHLQQLLGSDTGRVQAVVSGLPLRSLPRPVVRRIKHEIRKVLCQDGVFVQFTYDLRPPATVLDEQLKNERTRVVWKNMPPARIDTFVHQPDPSCCTSGHR